MENASKINVEVAYALPETQVLVELEVDPHATAEDAIIDSGILESFPEIDLKRNKVGIFGKLTKLSLPLKEGDRVEIYRALIADPKEVRRRRAAREKADKKAGNDLAGQ